MYVCVCVIVRGCAWACVCACVCVLRCNSVWQGDDAPFVLTYVFGSPGLYKIYRFTPPPLCISITLYE